MLSLLSHHSFNDVEMDLSGFPTSMTFPHSEHAHPALADPTHVGGAADHSAR